MEPISEISGIHKKQQQILKTHIQLKLYSH